MTVDHYFKSMKEHDMINKGMSSSAAAVLASSCGLGAGIRRFKFRHAASQEMRFWLYVVA